MRQLVGPARKIFAVVKADGYGHGAAELGAVFVAHGADALAVADLGEGIRLRQRGITAPVLVYPNSLPEAAPEALAHRLTPALVDLDAARAYAQAATGPCDIFVKIDVGLERLGVPAEQAVKTITAMLELPHLRAGRAVRPSSRPTAPIRHIPNGSSAASPRSSTSCRRAGIAVPIRLLRGLALRAALPADVPQRRRSRPDALRHHVPRRDAADAAPAGASRHSSPASSRSRS